MLFFLLIAGLSIYIWSQITARNLFGLHAGLLIEESLSVLYIDISDRSFEQFPENTINSMQEGNNIIFYQYFRSFVCACTIHYISEELHLDPRCSINERTIKLEPDSNLQYYSHFRQL